MISVNNALSKQVRGRRSLVRLKSVWYRKKVGLSIVSPFVGAHRFSFSVGLNENISVALTPEDTSYTVRLFAPVFPHILARGEGRGLSEKLCRGPGVQGFVIYLGWRVGCRFRSSHV